MSRVRGRRPGGLDTRSAIVAEARRCFGEAGYGPTTLRRVAARAGVDPRLVLHYFGSKRALFLEAVEFPIDPATVVTQVLHGAADSAGERVAALLLSVLEDPVARQAYLALLRSAVTDEEAAGLIRDILTERILLPIAREIAIDRPELRASMVGSLVVGVIVARHVVALPPMVTASHDELIAALAPAITHYLQGQWAAGSAEVVAQSRQ